MEKYSSIISQDCIKIFEEAEDLFIDAGDFDNIFSILKSYIDSWYKSNSASSHTKYNIIFTPNKGVYQYSLEYYISAYTLYELIYIASKKLGFIFGLRYDESKRFFIKDGYLVDSVYFYDDIKETVINEYKQLLKVEDKINVKDIIMTIITNPNSKKSLEGYYFKKLDLNSYE